MPRKSSPPSTYELYASCIVLIVACLAQYGIRLEKIGNSYLSGLFFSDSGLYVYLSKVAFPSIIHGSWFDLGFFYPYGKTLAWSDNFILPSMGAYVFELCGASHTLAYNLILLISLFATGFTTLKLAEAMGADRWSATVAGVLAIGGHVLRANAGHVQIQFSFFIPIVLLLLMRLVSALKKNEVDKWGALMLGITVSTSFLTTVYYALFSLVIIAITVGLTLPQYVKNYRSWSISLVWFFLGFWPCLPFMLPYLEVKEAFGGRKIIESVIHAARPVDYLGGFFKAFAIPESAMSLVRESKNAGSFSLLLLALGGIWVTFRSFGSPSLIVGCIIAVSVMLSLSAALSITVITVACTLLALWYVHNKKGDSKEYLLVAFIAVALFSMALSYGPRSPSEWSPYRLLYEFFPGGSALRVAARFSIIWYYLAFVLAAIALGNLRLPWVRRVFTAVVLVESYTFSMVPINGVWTPTFNAAQPYAAELSSSAVAVFLPTISATVKKSGGIQYNLEAALRNVRAMMHSAELGIPTIQGYSGFRGDLSKQSIEALRSFPDETSYKFLKQFVQLRYVFYEGHLLAPSRRKEFLSHIESSGRYKVLYQDKNFDLVMEVIGPVDVVGEYSLYLPAKSTGVLRLVVEAKEDVKLSIAVPSGLDGAPTVISMAAGERREVEMELPGMRGGGGILPQEIHLKLLSGRAVALHSATLKP
jgi:hypothetical protein